MSYLKSVVLATYKSDYLSFLKYKHYDECKTEITCLHNTHGSSIMNDNELIFILTVLK